MIHTLREGIFNKLLDVIEVNEAGKITSIRSYWDQEPVLVAIGAKGR